MAAGSFKLGPYPRAHQYTLKPSWNSGPGFARRRKALTRFDAHRNIASSEPRLIRGSIPSQLSRTKIHAAQSMHRQTFFACSTPKQLRLSFFALDSSDDCFNWRGGCARLYPLRPHGQLGGSSSRISTGTHCHPTWQFGGRCSTNYTAYCVWYLEMCLNSADSSTITPEGAFRSQG